jgi:short-subunit dehydrogenase
MKDLAGKTALITGASSGLGEAYALKLASLGVKVILVARRADRLRALADRITTEHGIYAASALPMDLSARDAGSTLAKILKGRGTQIDILINNAGFGQTIKFVEEDNSFIVD